MSSENPINCPNCGASTSANTQYNTGATPPGTHNNGVVVQKNQPLARAAQSMSMPGSGKVVAPPANPIMDRRQHPIPPRTPNINNDEQIVSSLSDENAEKIDREHLENVNSSANALGL